MLRFNDLPLLLGKATMEASESIKNDTCIPTTQVKHTISDVLKHIDDECNGNGWYFTFKIITTIN